MDFKKEKMLAIINGKGLKKSRLNKLIDFFNINKISVEVTRYKHHEKDILQNVQEYTGIIIIGGDGTIHEIVNNINNSKKWIAFFPGGTVNCISHCFRMKSNTKFLDVFLNQNIQEKVDVLDVDFITTHSTFKRFILGFITVGHLTSMTMVSDQLRWLNPFFRYPVSALINCFKKSREYTTIINDNGHTQKKAFTSLVVNNIGAGHFTALKDSKYNDGFFELKIEDNTFIKQYLSIINRYFRLNYVDQWERDKTFIQLKFDKALPVMADGEVYADVLGLKIKIARKFQEVRIPKREL